MNRAPGFWARDAFIAQTLSPLSGLVSRFTARRVAKPGWVASVPVMCCGNATVGGAGKTTLALDLVQRLTARGIAVHVLSRGYGGTARGPRRVLPEDTAETAGDEALLLAAAAPTWTGADRAASARAAIAAGAEILIMDDGLQNPSLVKTMSLLVVDGASGFGNGRVLPAGPLREPVASAAQRCHAAVLIGPDSHGAMARLPAGLPVLRASLAQSEEAAALKGRRVFAFAGIAFPDKFFSGLDRAGAVLSGRLAFPDHHQFRPAELARIAARAKALDAILVTTPKDAVRLPPGVSAQVIGVRLVWNDEPALEALLDQLVTTSNPLSPARPVHGMSGP